jgi:hypothetical protein
MHRMESDISIDVSRLWAGRQAFYSQSHRVQTGGPGAHPASYKMGTEGSIPTNKAGT